MNKKLLMGTAIMTLLFGGTILASGKPPITMEQAEAIALKRIKGSVEQADTVERHNKPVYSFFIKEADGVTAHILVSDQGKIKRIADETPATAKIK